MRGPGGAVLWSRQSQSKVQCPSAVRPQENLFVLVTVTALVKQNQNSNSKNISDFVLPLTFFVCFLSLSLLWHIEVV